MVRKPRSLGGRPQARRSPLPRALLNAAVAWAAIVCHPLLSGRADGATARSPNFEVTADSAELAQLIALHAEELRATLATDWLEAELAAWETPCVVRVDTGRERLSGDTTYALTAGRMLRWRMELRGPPERILETLLPHEVLHTVLASHFRRAVPRWADEGAALSVEPEVERGRLWAQEGPQLLRGPRRSLAELFDCDEYPANRDDLRAFYAQGASVTEFLLLGGKAEFVNFMGVGMRQGWDRAAAAHYGFTSVENLEAAWLAWLHEERPVVALADGQLLAEALGAAPSTSMLATDLPATLPVAVNSGAQ